MPVVKVTTREKYSFCNAAVGKYARRYKEGTNLVLLDPDVASAFPDSKSVNDALRSLMQLAERGRTGH